jgi:hypothetical protein
MREIKHKRFHFIYSLTLLTLKEEESFNRIEKRKLQGVRNGVNLGQFGIVKTHYKIEASKLSLCDLLLYLASYLIFTLLKDMNGVNGASLREWELTRCNNLYK